MARAVGVLSACIILISGARGASAAAEGGAADDEVGVVPTGGPAAEPSATPEPGYGVWDRLAACESTSNWHAATGNGYWGGLQFDLPSWRAAGGYGRPDQASRAEQIRVGQNWQRIRGWSAWPACSRKLGLR
jgi:hypothetical protein